MAHELTMNNGRADMAYTGETPWHGLGQQLPVGAPIEVWAEAAGMAHTIQRSYVRFATSRDATSDTFGTMDSNVVLWRSDNGRPLAVVGHKYHVVQPIQVLEFFRDLVDTGNFQLSTAGTLFGGRRYWALAKISEGFTLPGGDEVKGNLLLATACDETLATIGKVVGTRVVCNNTLSMARGENSAHVIKIKHNTRFDPEVIKRGLGIAADQFAAFEASAVALANTRVSVADAQLFLADIFSSTMNGTTGRDVTNTKPYQLAVQLLDFGRGARMESARGTAWGVLNAVTEYVDHTARAKSGSHRLSSAWLGAGDELKSHAMDYLLAKVA